MQRLLALTALALLVACGSAEPMDGNGEWSAVACKEQVDVSTHDDRTSSMTTYFALIDTAVEVEVEDCITWVTSSDDVTLGAIPPSDCTYSVAVPEGERVYVHCGRVHDVQYFAPEYEDHVSGYRSRIRYRPVPDASR